MGGTFTVIMQMGVSVAIMQVVFLQNIMYMTFSILIIQVALSFAAMQVTVSSNNFIFLSLTDVLVSLLKTGNVMSYFYNLFPRSFWYFFNQPQKMKA